MSLPDDFKCKIRIRETEKSKKVTLDEKAVKFTEEMKTKLRIEYDRCLTQEEHGFLAKYYAGHYKSTFIEHILKYRIKDDK